MKKVIFTYILFLFATNLFAGNGLHQSFYTELDSVLLKSGLKKHDIWLPNDHLGELSNELKNIKMCFDNPMKSIDISQEIDNIVQKFNIGNSEETLRSMMSYLDINAKSAINLSAPVSEKEIRSFFEMEYDSKTNLVTTMVLNQYLSIFYNAIKAMHGNPIYSEINKYKHVMQYYDSVLFSLRKKPSSDYIENIKYDNEFEKSKEKFAEHSEIFANSNTIAIASSLFKALVEQNKKLLELPQELLSELQNKEVITKYGKVAIGLRQNNQYDGDYMFILDLGGNDAYMLAERDKSAILNRPVSVIIDLDGNDIYRAGNYSLGGTAFGISLLLDYKGNDQYISKDVSLGCGIFGIGVLIDLDGDDTYQGGIYTQGASAFGIGLLIDEKGNDKYYSEAYSQGFASSRALGILLDKSGDDIYISSSQNTDAAERENRYVSFSQGAVLGVRPYSASGYGLLIDNAGDDIYKCESFGQGVSHWYGIGSLIDKSGDDQYSANRHAQGSGTRYGFGLLIDYNGNDAYQSLSESQGCGHNTAFGALLDFAGNDKYSADNLFIGCGNSTAISIFFDKMGDDVYLHHREGSGLTYLNFRSASTVPAIFADIIGKYIYFGIAPNSMPKAKASSSTFWGDSYESELHSHDAPEKAQGSSVEELFMEATATAPNMQKYKKSAIDELIARGKETLEFIKSEISSKNTRVANICKEVIKGIALKNSGLVEDFLKEQITSEDARAADWSIEMVAKLGFDKIMIDVLAGAIPAASVTHNAIADAIEKLFVDAAVPMLYSLAVSEDKIIRMKVAYIMGKNVSKIDFKHFKPLLLDEYYAVSNSAIEGLFASNSPVISTVINLFAMGLSDAVCHELLSRYENKKLSKDDIKSLKATIKTLSDDEKQFLYTKLAEHKNISSLINEIEKIEKDKKLKSILKSGATSAKSKLKR